MQRADLFGARVETRDALLVALFLDAHRLGERLEHGHLLPIVHLFERHVNVVALQIEKRLLGRHAARVLGERGRVRVGPQLEILARVVQILLLRDLVLLLLELGGAQLALEERLHVAVHGRVRVVLGLLRGERARRQFVDEVLKALGEKTQTQLNPNKRSKNN